MPNPSAKEQIPSGKEHLEPAGSGLRAKAPTAALIVDDDEGLRECFREILQEAGYRARSVASIAEALVILEEDPPALLLIDYLLVGETSEELLEVLCIRESAPATVIVSASPRVPFIAMRYGVLFVPKPFGIDELTQQLTRALHEERRPRRL